MRSGRSIGLMAEPACEQGAYDRQAKPAQSAQTNRGGHRRGACNGTISAFQHFNRCCYDAGLPRPGGNRGFPVDLQFSKQEALRISVSLSLLARADEVIE